MKAIYYDQFGERPFLRDVADPVPGNDSVIIEVRATGICLSDWHGWMGHDADIRLPHVPGHEFSGEVISCGNRIRNWRKNDRVTVPFVCGCYQCDTCKEGNPQVCPNQFQPGFTHWGSFAKYVEIKYADSNLVRLPETMSYEEAASLGCRFTTAFRAVVDQGRIKEGEWLTVYGCGGVGLSIVMIAKALGARIIAVDTKPAALELAAGYGSDYCIQAGEAEYHIEEIRSLSGGGAHLSIDAYGSNTTCISSIASLRRRGRHIQVGLMTEGSPSIPMSRVIAEELEIIGSHGIQASRFEDIFTFIKRHAISLESMIQETCHLEEGIDRLVHLNEKPSGGISVINQFE